MNFHDLFSPNVTYVSSSVSLGSATASSVIGKTSQSPHITDFVLTSNTVALISLCIAVLTFAVNTWFKWRQEKRQQALWEKQMEDQSQTD